MSRETRLSKYLRAILGTSAPIEFQDIAAMADGDTGKTNAEVIAEKVIQAARTGDKWAIEFIRDTAEGKPAATQQGDDGARRTEEKLRDVTKQHLNQFAESFAQLGAPEPVAAPAGDAGPGKGEPAGPPVDPPAGPTRSLMDLPQDGDEGPEGL